MPNIVEDLLVDLQNANKKLRSKLPDGRLLSVVMQCCDVSRDIRLFAGPPNSSTSTLREKIFATISETSKVVDSLDTSGLSDIDRQKLEQYAKNIRMRVEVFTTPLPAEPSRATSSPKPRAKRTRAANGR